MTLLYIYKEYHISLDPVGKAKKAVGSCLQHDKECEAPLKSANCFLCAFGL